MEDVRYPIGKFNPVADANEQLIMTLIEQIDQQSDLAREAVVGITETQIDTPYREGGWTVRQVIHHIADAHINAYIRFKLAITEDKPTVKLWDEVTWAECEDAKKAPVSLSLSIIEGIHKRWAILLKSLEINDFKKELIHPEMGNIALSTMLQLYAWHGNHHISQIKLFRDRINI